MPKYSTNQIRNLAFIGGAGSGKTTLVEALLHAAGEIGRAGRVEDGNTVCDHEELEREFTCSLDSALVHFDLGGAHVNIIDTPGQADFLGKSISVLPAVETAVVVLDASSGIEPTVRRLMKITKERRLPTMIVINKIDHADDLPALVAAVQETFGSECRPINLPTDGGKGIIDCFRTTEGSSDLGDVSDYHTSLVEQIVEVDETLMEQYLEQGEVSPDKLHDPLHQAMREAHLIPICFCSARENVGVKELAEIFASLCPDPLHGNPRPFAYTEGGETKRLEPEADDNKPLVAHVFKVASDPYVGKLSVFRVHQGHVGSDISPRLNDLKKPVRVAHVFKLQGKEHAEVDRIVPGDIGAVAKIDEIDHDMVMHDGTIAEDLHLQALPMPKPMFGLAIEGTSKGAESKMGDALRKMSAEDPTFVVERVRTTGEMVIRGLGEQHLRGIKLRMLKDRYGVEVDTHPPKIAYKETISAKAEGHHRHKKQSGGAGQFGEVYLRVEPAKGDEEGFKDGLAFVDDTFGGSIPKQFLPAVEKGVRRVMSEGAIAGYPLQDIKVSVYDGKHHPVDSKEIAFMTAGRKAFIDAIQKARPVLLEPFVHMEITVPSSMIGDITSDISGRRGRIQGTDMLPGDQAIVTVEVPLAEVTSYSSQLKSMSGGTGSYTMDYSHDEPTPPNVQADVVKSFQPKEDED